MWKGTEIEEDMSHNITEFPADRKRLKFELRVTIGIPLFGNVSIHFFKRDAALLVMTNQKLIKP
jgi:hypothetical protein